MDYERLTGVKISKFLNIGGFFEKPIGVQTFLFSNLSFKRLVKPFKIIAQVGASQISLSLSRYEPQDLEEDSDEAYVDFCDGLNHHGLYDRSLRSGHHQA